MQMMSTIGYVCHDSFCSKINLAKVLRMFGTIFQHIQIEREDIEVNEVILGMMDASNTNILAQGVSDSQHEHYVFQNTHPLKFHSNCPPHPYCKIWVLLIHVCSSSTFSFLFLLLLTRFETSCVHPK
jgi:hypothetical protein